MKLKTPEEIAADVRRRLADTWHTSVAAEASPPARQPDDSAQRTPWPAAFPLGEPTGSDLAARFGEYQKATRLLLDWAASNGLHLRDTTRRVHGTTQPMPTHVHVPDIDLAARLSGEDWTERITRARIRAKILHHDFPGLEDLARAVREADPYTEVDFVLLVASARWFASNNAAGLTPRQVPIPGLHAKWLNSHQRLVATLAGKPDLQLLPRHPPRIHFTYLDPEHRRTGGRWHDSITVGDRASPAYAPDVVVISENKDTALHLPELPKGISVEGAGYGGNAIAAVEWIRTCPQLFYWGDMDASGFEILDGFREAGLSARSVLMSAREYEKYERFGTAVDARGKIILPGRRRELEHLTTTELELYERLTDPSWKGYRRIEQEKIPLHMARDAVLYLLAESS